MSLERLRETTFSGCGLVPERPVLVAVSGGPDSLCLLDGLARLGLPVTAAYFDHALRPESEADGSFVRRAAERIGAAFVTARGDVSEYASQNRMTIEEAARVLRYQFLFAQASDLSAQAVAVGHTADDQVETVLMHLLRGAGLAGLTGMPYRTVISAFDPQIPLVRPLLCFWRAETLDYCREHDLHPLFDATNQDPAFFRNRVRLELIPLLEQYNPRIRQALVRTARILAADEDVVRSAVQAAWEQVFIEQADGAVALELDAFRALATGLQRAVLRQAAALFQPGLDDVDFEAVERALRWALHPGSGAVDLTGGISAAVEGWRLWVGRLDALPVDLAWPVVAGQVDLPVPGKIELGGDWQISAEWRDAVTPPASLRDEASAWTAHLDADQITGPLVVRRPLPGDRFQPLGLNGHTVRLSDFWINQKLPRRARQDWPLVTCGGEILWVPGYRLAHPFRVSESTHRVLLLRAYRKT